MNSSFLSFIQLDTERVQNCVFVSRLSLADPPSTKIRPWMRAIEVLEPLTVLFPGAHPRLAVEIVSEEPRIFELGLGYVRLGSAWLTDSVQIKRALIMGVLKRDQPHHYSSAFQLETMTDFLMMTLMGQTEWYDHPVSRDVKFATMAPLFADYCRSPFRSLAHYSTCHQAAPDSLDMHTNIWGLRPLLAVALWRVFKQSSVRQQLTALASLREASRTQPLPPIQSVHNVTAPGATVHWLSQTLRQHLTALNFTVDDEPTAWAIKRTLKELEVEYPTRWELTVDITSTPAWREILAQLKTWNRMKHRPQQRALIFTPEGAVALPSGLSVAWTAGEIQSQTHVLIACQWPKTDTGMAVTARHMFAKQSCAKVDQIFWN